MEMNKSALQKFLNYPIGSLPNTSGLTIKRLQNIGINTYWDLLNYFPSRYENYSLISPIGTIQEGELVTVKGKIIKMKQEFTKRGFRLQKVILSDGTGEIELVWFNQGYLLKLFKVDDYISVAGEVKPFLSKKHMEPTAYEILTSPEQPTVHTGKIIPIYPEVRGLSSKTIREKINFILNSLTTYNSQLTTNFEWLPSEILSFNNLIPEFEAYKQIHSPDDMEKQKQANERLSFDELFTIQLSSVLVRQAWKKETVSIPLHLDEEKIKKVQDFIKNLPFILTNAQNQVIKEILHDLKQTTPMNRFLQGDVGSGKTVVAAVASYIAYLHGYQSLIMAPTEILALQHFSTISKLFQKYNLKIGLQTGSTKSIDKKNDSSQFDIIIGTHALITKKVNFEKVAFVVIDEQHRFGVAQRAELKQKGINPHLLTMTATPIPRTVSLTLYGELDLSVINEMPKGRLPIKTYLTPHQKRIAAYEWIKKQILEDKIQVYIICPLIEESEIETMQTVRAATKEYEYLKCEVFKKFNVAMLHGKMKPKEKEQVMQDFKDKKYDILVSTSVVEVGIDIPNATLMIIEGAERFGLAQLHQLRGRVGRGEKQSYCLLFTSKEDATNNKRLEFFTRTNSGMELAEFDLKIRGPGQIFGIRQSGYANLKIATFLNMALIQKTKLAVGYFLNHHSLDKAPKVKERLEKHQIEQIARD